MDNIFSDIFSIVEIDKLHSKHEFDLLIDNLTNRPAPLREAVAYKLEEVFCEEYADEKTAQVILCAITDINPNVSRNICQIIEKSSLLKTLLEERIINKINTILGQIPEIEQRKNNKSHVKNKLFFALYWLLEALSYCISNKYNEKIFEILQICINFTDYTIREKTAKILSIVDNPPIELVDKIKSDTNFYVNFYTTLYKK